MRMPELLHPGVYVIELPAAVKPIEGVSTSTAGFVGVTDKGPLPGFHMPVGAAPVPPLITSFAEYSRLFGGYRSDSFLTYAVQNFFDNGGKRAYIVRVGELDNATASSNVQIAISGLADVAGSATTLAVIARSPGAWANTLSIGVDDAANGAPNDFKLVVYENGVPVESFDNLSMDSTLPNFVEHQVNSQSQYIYVRAALPTGVTPADGRPSKNPASVDFTDTNG